jgi:hypothetical protein
MHYSTMQNGAEEEDEDDGGMPDMEGIPGMGGGGAAGIQQMLMQLLMSDPELAAGIQNPKMMNAFMGVMQGGNNYLLRNVLLLI